MAYKKMAIYRAKEHLQRDAFAPVTIVDWHRSRINNCDVLFVIGSYTMHFRPEDRLEPMKRYRMAVFVNGKPRMGDDIDG